jgi:hypothetical protein
MLAVKYSEGQVKEKKPLGMYGTKQKENLKHFVYILPFFLEGGGSIYNLKFIYLFIK